LPEMDFQSKSLSNLQAATDADLVRASDAFFTAVPAVSGTWPAVMPSVMVSSAPAQAEVPAESGTSTNDKCNNTHMNT
jgi:hypothetical protein